jgi:uncharacterized protein (TIGR02118 family)
MIKAVCMFKLKKGISEEDFEEYFKTHVVDAKKLPNLKKYTIARAVKAEDRKDCYRINELYYDSLKDLEDSFSSELGSEASEDLMRWVDDFKCIIVDENKVM